MKLKSCFTRRRRRRRRLKSLPLLVRPTAAYFHSNTKIAIIFVKMYKDNPSFFLFIFILSSFQFHWQIRFHQYKLKKHTWLAWDSKPGPQDGRCRQNNGAMAAAKNCYCCTTHQKLFTWNRRYGAKRRQDHTGPLANQIYPELKINEKCHVL